MAEILEFPTHTDYEGCDDITEEQANALEKFWFETDKALQIILRTQSFIPGTYESPNYHTSNWRKVPTSVETKKQEEK